MEIFNRVTDHPGWGHLSQMFPYSPKVGLPTQCPQHEVSKVLLEPFWQGQLAALWQLLFILPLGSSEAHFHSIQFTEV